MRFTPRYAAIAALVLSVLIVYRDILTKLVHDWATDGNYSHGFLVVPIAAYFARERPQRLSEAVSNPSLVGLLVVIGSLVTLIGGLLGAELFLTRISLVGL